MARDAFLLIVAFVAVHFFTNFWFLIHNFGSSYARKPIKGSKDSDDNLVSRKNVSQKIGSLVWRPGSGKVGQKDEKTPPLMTTQTQYEKFFFSILTRRFSEFVDV